MAIDRELVVVPDNRNSQFAGNTVVNNITAGLANFYLYNATTGALLQRLTTPHLQAGAQMGFEVGMSGDVALVSATSELVSGRFGTYGHVYAFNAKTGELLDDFTSPNLNSTMEFGTAVAISGDLAIVGARGTYVGSAYLFDIRTGSVLGNMTSPGPETAGSFGSAIATKDGLAVIGAPAEDSGSLVVAGHAYIFAI